MTDLPDSVTDGTANQPAVIGLEITGEPTGLYRFYDRVERLLYVGISRNLHTRWGQHEAEKTWWPLVAKRTVVMYGSREEAELAEGRAIRSESPLHNKAMGRRDKTEPKRRVPKPSPEARQIRTLGPRDSFAVPADLQAYVDDYAKRQNISSVEAVQKFFSDGMVQCLGEELVADIALFEAERELEAFRAAQGA